MALNTIHSNRLVLSDPFNFLGTLQKNGADLLTTGSLINATQIGNGSVSNTEFQFLDGVTSSIQTQINNVIATVSSRFQIFTFYP